MCTFAQEVQYNLVVGLSADGGVPSGTKRSLHKLSHPMLRKAASKFNVT